MAKVYYDADAAIEALQGKTIGIVGYGIQGRAHALNLRDAGLTVRIANREDRYTAHVREDGFCPEPIAEVARAADLLLLLIPDQAHKAVYTDALAPFLRRGAALCVAHGFSLRFGEMNPREDLDVLMCAPRMPGRQIRDYFLRGHGVPAFVDVVRDATDHAWPTVLALAKAMGFTRAGAMHVRMAAEAEVDLLVEQFLIPTILKTIQVSFDGMVAAGYDPLPVAMELFASGELGEVLLRAAHVGLYRTFRENASPTCQFGIASSYEAALGSDARAFLAEVIERVRSGAFARSLAAEGEAGYPATNAQWQRTEEFPLVEAHRQLQQLLKVSR